MASTTDPQRPPSADSCRSSSSTASRKKVASGKVSVGEEVKIAVDVALHRFKHNEEQKELDFPTSLTSSERAYVHKLCAALGYKTKSYGHGYNRFLRVTKKSVAVGGDSVSSFSLIHNSRHHIQILLQQNPITQRERLDLQIKTERGQHNEQAIRELSRTVIGRVHNAVPQVPPSGIANPELNAFRQALPAYGMREEIMGAINDNKVVIIAGETGSGKTTQVPQMILDHHHAQNTPCRIFCTQPRRIAALTVADRVAAERGEVIGHTVGYQIRLESRASMNTILMYCTTGVLLRTLMSKDDEPLASVTHVIIDEIHERDRYSDFLLITIRDLLSKYPNLHVILMSAMCNIELFVEYFSGCPVVNIPGRLFDVEEHFLSDVLKTTGYMTKEMQRNKRSLENESTSETTLHQWVESKQGESHDADKGSDGKQDSDEGGADDEGYEEDDDANITLTGCDDDEETIEETTEPAPEVISQLDELLSQVFLTGDKNAFTQLLQIIVTNHVSVDYMHSKTHVSPLMVACSRGMVGVVEQLITMGANIHLPAGNGWTPLDWANNMGQPLVAELLQAQMSVTEYTALDQSESALIKESDKLSEEDKLLLKCYHQSFNDECVDIQLIVTLVHYIHTQQKPGAILIFLPGYEDIMSVKEAITDDPRLHESTYSLFMLHSSMQTTDQRRVFKPMMNGNRKIILSTDIAETSVTINDVVYVINTGKVKEKSFDALTNVSSLKVEWTSKASVLQRKGRAGRSQPGVCYNLFSRIRYDNMLEFQTPELLRYPLEELCLHTKLLASVSSPIADFLRKAPEPPAYLVTRNAVHLLKQIDALDCFEDLTEIGHHLADLPIAPRYGKMLLYSIVLKCIDPVLTIVCILSYRDPFILPARAFDKRRAAETRIRFSCGTFSDHMALLRAFQGWQKAIAEGWEKAFCRKNLLSAATLETVVGLRTHLLGHLRASGFIRPRGSGDIRDLNANSENWAVIKAAITGGAYPNVVRVDRQKHALVSLKESRARFHNSSALAPLSFTPPAGKAGFQDLKAIPTNHKDSVTALPCDWLVYDEMTRGQRLARVRCCTVVTPVTIALFTGSNKLPQQHVVNAENGTVLPKPMQQRDEMLGGAVDDSPSSDADNEQAPANYTLDDFIRFNVEPEVSSLTMQLREKWHAMFLRRMRQPNKIPSQGDELTVKTIVNVLTNEDQVLKLTHPVGIGRRPRPMPEYRSGGGSFDNSDSLNSSTGSLKNNHKNRTEDNRSDCSSTQSGYSSHSSNNNSPPQTPPSPTTPCASDMVMGPPSFGPIAYPPEVSAFHPARFFVMKSATQQNLDVSLQRGIWATSIAIEKKICKALKDGKSVYLIFSVQGSNSFQGYAKMSSLPGFDHSSELQGVNLGATFSVDWIHRATVSFQQTQHLVNALDDNKKVQESKDGQELEPALGESLLKLWDGFTALRRDESLSLAGGPAVHNPAAAAAASVGYDCGMDIPPYYSPTQTHHATNRQRYWTPNPRGRPIHGSGFNPATGMGVGGMGGPGAAHNPYNMAGFGSALPPGYPPGASGPHAGHAAMMGSMMQHARMAQHRGGGHQYLPPQHSSRHMYYNQKHYK